MSSLCNLVLLDAYTLTSVAGAVGSLILGATRKDAFGYTFVAAALNGLRFALFDAETIGASKYSRIYFVAFPLLVAAASFATLEPSELLSP